MDVRESVSLMPSESTDFPQQRLETVKRRRRRRRRERAGALSVSLSLSLSRCLSRSSTSLSSRWPQRLPCAQSLTPTCQRQSFRLRLPTPGGLVQFSPALPLSYLVSLSYPQSVGGDLARRALALRSSLFAVRLPRSFRDRSSSPEEKRRPQSVFFAIPHTRCLPSDPSIQCPTRSTRNPRGN